MKVGFTARLSTILSMRPSIAVGKPICNAGCQQLLAEDVGQRQPEVLQVVLLRIPIAVDPRRPGRSTSVQQPHALGPAGGARGVDDRGEVVGLDGVDPLVDGARGLGQQRAPGSSSSSPGS
jgi:hypothetical protein